MAGLVGALGKLLAPSARDEAPAPRAARAAPLPPRPLPRAPGPAPSVAPAWDAAEAGELETYFTEHADNEHAVAAALVERLTGRSWGAGEDPLAARGLLWRDASALPLLLSPALLLRVSPPLALSALAFLAAGVRARMGNAEAARACGAGSRLARLLARLADESERGTLPDEAQAQSVPLADAALECLADVLSHHCGADELQARRPVPCLKALALFALRCAALTRASLPQAMLLLLQGSDPRGWLQSRALRCFASVAAAPEARPCFDLTGDSAGLAVDVAPPACSAATVQLWARLEAPPATSPGGGGPAWSSPLFALRCADGSGVAAAADAETGELTLRALGADGAPRGTPARSAPGAVRRGVWTSLCVALQRATLLPDTAVAYVDGVEVLRTSLPFPAALSSDAAPGLRLFLGTWGFNNAPADDGAPPAPAMPPALRGQLGAVAMFAQCAATGEEAAALAAAGAGGAPLAPPARTLGDRRSAAAHGARGSALPPRLAEKGHRRVVFALDPRSVAASAVAAPGRAWGAATRARAPPAAELLPGTRAVLPRALAATAAAAGGPAVLLPLLASREAAVTALSPGAGAGDALQLLTLLPLPPPGRGLGPASLAACVALLPHLLASARPGEAAAASRAAAVLLRAAPAEALTPQLAAALADVGRALDAAALAAGASDAPPPWEAAALLVLDVRWWRAAPPGARRALWAAMGTYLEAAPDDAAGALGGEHLCRAMRGDGCGDEAAADERAAMLRIVAALAAQTARPEVRAAVARQLVRFVYAALPEPPEAVPSQAAPPEAVLAAAQLVISELSREAGRAPPPLPREGKRDEWLIAAQAPRGAGVTQLLQAGGGFVAAALARRLAAHPSVALAALANSVWQLAFNGDAAAAAAAATAAAQDGGPAVVAALLAGSASNAAARAGAAAAQAWAAEPGGGGVAAWAQLRRLRSGPGPWAPLPGDADSDSAQLPGGRAFWRLDDAACGDGGRRRLLRLDRDGSCAKAARAVHDAPLPRAVAALAVADTVLPRASPRASNHDDDAGIESGDDDVAPHDHDAALPLDAAGAEADHEGSDNEADDVDDAEDDDDDDGDEEASLTAAAHRVSITAGEPPATPIGGRVAISDDAATPATPMPHAPPVESDGGGRSGADGPLSRLKRAAAARAGAAASGMAARAAIASRRAAEALTTAREASARVALASELVTEQLAFGVALAHAVTSSTPSAADAPPLPPWAAAPPAPPRGFPGDAVSFCGPAEWIRPGGVTRGTACVVPGHLVFLPASAASGAAWPLALATGLQLRRRHMARSGVELFLNDGRSALLNLLPTAASADAPPQARPQALHAAVVMQRPPCARGSYSRSLLPPPRLVERAGWTRAWQRREMTTFEYLMRLNEAAGRSFNDLSQYPVLPWVLADYESAVLDLTSPASFRDLSKPMGAQTPARAAAAAAAYAALEGDPDTPPFHHGSFYCSPGGVLHGLLRLAPFAALHVELQGGCFDHADRLLHGVGSAWHSAVSSSYDNRELPPEWFTAPAAFRNESHLPLGTCQDGAAVGDVALPVWAGGSAEAFCRMHRAALESEHVSQHIHAWIDLVFGAKQRGPEAAAALNVFHYTCYEGEVDVKELTDEHQQRIFADRCDNFGQVPMQLFRAPHPPRGPPPSEAPVDETAAVARAAHDRAVVGVAFHPSAALVHTVDAGGRGRSFRLPARGARLVLEALDGEPLAGVLPPGWAACAPPRASASGLLAASAEFGPPGGGVLSAGWFDGAALCFGRDLRGKARPAVRAAQLGASSASTCLALDAGVLAVGAADGTASVWRPPATLRASARGPERAAGVLRGHAAPLTAVALAARANVAATGAADGTCALHALASASFVRALPLALSSAPSCADAVPFAVAALAVSCDGDVAVQLAASRGARSGAPSAELQVWSVNGVRLAAAPLPEPLLALAFAPDGRHLLTAGRAGAVLRDAHSLDVAAVLPAAPLEDAPPLASAALSPDGAFVVVGLADGSVALYRTPQLPPWESSAAK